MAPRAAAHILRKLMLPGLVTIAAALMLVGATGPLSPTGPQLRYQSAEIVALIHFNMATFFRNGDPGCDTSNWAESSKPSSFDPSALDTDNWAASILDLGAKASVLTAKHGCGFAIWPTNATLPNGQRYPYRVGQEQDVLSMYAASMRAHGIGHGFYYSLTNNFFLNVCGHKAGACVAKPVAGQHPVTQAQFEALAVQQLTELWSNYGNLTEIWFDGGYTSDMKGTLTALLQAKQPDAVGYNGGGISANAVRWSGTEGDVPPCGSGTRKGEKSCPDVWCTACCDTCWGAGCRPDHDNATYYPSGTDYTLQAGDVWFYEPQAPLRHLDELIFTYHSTVGHNTAMELDFAIDRTGRVDPAHAALYKRFGDWRRSCYGTPSQEVQVSFVGPHSIVMPAAPDGHSQTLIDRVVASEDLRAGQQVTGYTVEVKTLHGWVLFGSGQSIGSKRIHLGDGQQSYNASAVRVNVTAALGPVQLTLAAFHPCDTGGLAGLTRLGTADIGMTETTPIVVNDTLYRFESVRGDYWNNSKQGPAVGPTSYLRLRQQSREADGWRIGPTVTPPFGVGYGLGCAVVEDETQEVWAFATQEANAVSVWHSQGLNTWVPGVAITAPSGWKIFNTAVAKGVLAGTVVYAMALEVGAPFHGFDLIFATSTSLAGPWTLGATAPGSVTLGAGPGSCPALRYDSASGYWQLLYTPNPTVRAGGYRTWQIYAMRSRSLATGTWEASPNNPVLVADSRDRVIHNRDLPLAIQQWARNTTNLNNSDPDLVEVDGKVLLVLNWGDQRSTPTDNLAQVVFNGTLAEFWQSLYPTY